MEVNHSAYFIENADSPVHAPYYIASGRCGTYWTTNIFEAKRFATDTMAAGYARLQGLDSDQYRIADHILTEVVDYEVVDTGEEETGPPEHVRSTASAEDIIRAAGEVA